jgi:ElaB/YqjD/DUF883 family membrane-anchored ribosome-binding protein
MGPEEQPIHTTSQTPEIPVSSMRSELEKQRQTSSRLLNDLGSAIYKSASQVTNRAGGAMASAARRTGHAAHYVQEQYLREMVTGLGRFIRRNPAPSLAVVLIAGFMVGRTLRNR